MEEVYVHSDESQSRSSWKRYLIIFGIIIIVIIILVAVFLFMNKPKNTSQNNNLNPIVNTENASAVQNTLKTCEELGGKMCYFTDICSSGWVNSSDNDSNQVKCCLGECTKTDRRGNCNELGGKICPSGKVCSQGTTIMDDTNSCCLYGECIVGTDEETNSECGGIVCKSDQVCVSGYCTNKACHDKGGVVCSRGQYRCSTSNFERIPYYVDGKDYGMDICCIGSCITADCFLDSDCNDATKKCVDGLCVSKGCTDSGNEVCDSDSFCNSDDSTIAISYDYSRERTIKDFISGSDRCCDGTCAKGDISISGPLNIDISSGTYVSFKINTSNSYISPVSSKALYVTMLEYEFYLDGQLYTNGTFTNYNGNNPLIYTGVAVSQGYICNGCIDSLRGKGYKIIIDPKNKLKETNENNNVLEGIIPSS